ncbi:MYB family transcription factor [Musa troglodytarum]|uniref:MYB family transcription factor n=1 Tax=Musa troglodytarum TaxID=320322 RepID=A0A9E7GWY0_9LILI|nr:MYB family transcription factor [Musa troglodytarum]
MECPRSSCRSEANRKELQASMAQLSPPGCPAW